MRALLLAFVLLALGCSLPPAPGSRLEVGTEVPAARGAVASVDELASRAGAQVLAQGGNAVDAAIATAFVLAVTWPEAGNIGGGGFMLVRPADGDPVFIDYRETAPRAATARMFLDDDGAIDPIRIRLGYLPVGIPGTVRGLEFAHRRYGTLPWGDLLRPAIHHARQGFRVSPALARSIADSAEELSACPEARRIFFTNSGLPIGEGEFMYRRDLADSLQLIADGGATAFYEGDIARRIVQDSTARGGILTLADFRDYRAVPRAPLRGTYRGFDILAGPPPTSGGAVLVTSLNQLEAFDLGLLPATSARELHLLAEAQRRSFLDRALYLGDPDYVDIPLSSLASKAHGLDLAASIDPARATPSDRIAGNLANTLPPEPGSTTHFSIVDRYGNAVSNTTTLEESWGAKIVARGTGIVLNNEMHDFNVTPGRSTRTGRIGTTPNLIEPGKRMLSSMCPVIITRSGTLFLVAGSPGGRSIPSTVLRVVTAMIDHEFPPRAAVDLPRIHHGLYPDVLRLEATVPGAERLRLAAMGHTLSDQAQQGDCHVIALDPVSNSLRAVADTRRAGASAAPR